MIEVKVLALSTAAVNNAVFYALTEKTTYNELIDLYKDESGKVTMVQANSVKINALARETSRISQESINNLAKEGIDVALGSLLNSPFLVGLGPMVTFKILPVGTVSANFYSEFENAGINQTRHKIFINIEAIVDVVLPFMNKQVISETEVLLVENIIIGEVPTTYLSMGGGGTYNLLPKINWLKNIFLLY